MLAHTQAPNDSLKLMKVNAKEAENEKVPLN